MTTLSLVMIVRDEEEVLPGFLRHHAGLAEQTVIVDTGSRDRTVELARAGGGEVAETEWRDDFAAARNEGLALARGDWVLILDADERLATRTGAALRELLDRTEPCVLIQETINYCNDPAHLEWQPVVGRFPEMEAGQPGYFAARRAGLFPGRSELRFRGRIHESILPSAERAGLPVREVDLPVHHYGYVRSAEINARRQERYLELARAKLADDPEDPGALLETATAWMERGRVDEALPLLERLVAGGAGLRPVTRGRFLLGRIYREQGRLEQALEIVEPALQDDPGFRFCWLEAIRCRAQEDSWARVADLIVRARAIFGRDDALLGKENLRCLIKTGRLDEARIQASALADLYPAWNEMRTLAARLGGRGASPGA